MYWPGQLRAINSAVADEDINRSCDGSTRPVHRLHTLVATLRGSSVCNQLIPCCHLLSIAFKLKIFHTWKWNIIVTFTVVFLFCFSQSIKYFLLVTVTEFNIYCFYSIYTPLHNFFFQVCMLKMITDYRNSVSHLKFHNIYFFLIMHVLVQCKCLWKYRRQYNEDVLVIRLNEDVLDIK